MLKERQQLAEDGVVTILAAISTDGAMVAPPRVNLRGVVTTADARKMSMWTEREVGWVLENRWKQLCRNTGGKAPEVDWMGVEREVEVGLGRRMRRELQVEPLILCLVQPAPAGTPAYKSKAMEEKDDRPAPRNRGGRHGGGGYSGQGRREPTPAPVRTNAARTNSASTNTARTAVAEKVEAKPVSAEPEMPAGRTRRRRSAAV